MYSTVPVSESLACVIDPCYTALHIYIVYTPPTLVTEVALAYYSGVINSYCYCVDTEA